MNPYGCLPVLCLAMCIGCSKPSASSRTEKQAAELPELSGFPEVRRLMLGEYQAQLKPVISIPVAAPVDGEVLFHVSHARSTLKRDEPWAEMGAEQLAAEKRALELNTLNERLRIREKLQTVERESQRVEFMMNDPALRDLPYEDRIPVSTNLVGQLQDEQQLLKEQLQTCGEVERLAFEQKALRSQLKMPFDGELLVYLPVSPERTRFRVAANTPIGIMRDLSELYLHIVVRDPQIVGIPPDRLFVELKREAGTVFRGHFHDTQVAELQKQDVLVYRFGFSRADTEALAGLIGANLTCELWVEGDCEMHKVPKLDVAMMLNGKGHFAGWGDAVQQLWPTAELLYSGRTDLGIAEE